MLVLESALAQYRPQAVHTARRYVGDTDADDCVQGAYLRAWRFYGAFHGGSSLETWLHTIVVNEARDMLRKRKTRREPVTDSLDAHHWPLASTENIEASVITGNLVGCIAQFAKCMAPRQRHAIESLIEGSYDTAIPADKVCKSHAARKIRDRFVALDQRWAQRKVMA